MLLSLTNLRLPAIAFLQSVEIATDGVTEKFLRTPEDAEEEEELFSQGSTAVVMLKVYEFLTESLIELNLQIYKAARDYYRDDIFPSGTLLRSIVLSTMSLVAGIAGAYLCMEESSTKAFATLYLLACLYCRFALIGALLIEFGRTGVAFILVMFGARILMTIYRFCCSETDDDSASSKAPPTSATPDTGQAGGAGATDAVDAAAGQATRAVAIADEITDENLRLACAAIQRQSGQNKLQFRERLVYALTLGLADAILTFFMPLGTALCEDDFRNNWLAVKGPQHNPTVDDKLLSQWSLANLALQFLEMAIGWSCVLSIDTGVRIGLRSFVVFAFLPVFLALLFLATTAFVATKLGLRPFSRKILDDLRRQNAKIGDLVLILNEAEDKAGVVRKGEIGKLVEDFKDKDAEGPFVVEELGGGQGRSHYYVGDIRKYHTKDCKADIGMLQAVEQSRREIEPKWLSPRLESWENNLLKILREGKDVVGSTKHSNAVEARVEEVRAMVKKAKVKEARIAKSAKDVQISGASYKDINDIYNPTENSYNGRPVYRQERDQHTQLFFSDSRWCVGDAEKKEHGANAALLRSSENSVDEDGMRMPTDVTEWFVAEGGGWASSPTVCVENFLLHDRLLKVLPTELLRRKGESVLTTELFNGKKYIFLYFGGKWCPHCPPFSKKLGEWLKNAREKGTEEVEVLFVSSDQSIGDFNEYYGHFSLFHALQYEEREAKEKLSKLFDVSGIPTTILLECRESLPTDAGTSRMECTVISKECRSNIENDLSAENFQETHYSPSAMPIVGDVADGMAAKGGSINDVPTIFLFVDKNSNPSILSDFEAVAKKTHKEWDDEGVEPMFIFLVCTSTAMFMRFAEAAPGPDYNARDWPLLLAFDVPGGEKYSYCTKTAGNLNKAAIEGFLDAFQANDITMTDFGEKQDALVVAPAAVGLAIEDGVNI